jgi:adenine-specific DNA-methyltransferase
MARRKDSKADDARTTDYRHAGEKRTNIPPAKIAAEGKVPKVEKVKYDYSPHLPPLLRFDPTGKADRLKELIAKVAHYPLTQGEQSEIAEALRNYEPWLEWAGKREQQAHGFFEVDPVALHIHERVSAQAIVRAAMREDIQRHLFADPQQPYHQAVQFYRHDIDWANRLILGDSLQVMSSLARRESLAGKVQMIYMDPPYAINFGSNFQPEAGRRDVKDRDQDLTREPETIKAYRDSWSLGKHTYLKYLGDRISAASDLLSDSGSLFVQINVDNLHSVRCLLDERMGSENFVSLISFRKVAGRSSEFLGITNDFIIWFAKNRVALKYNQLYLTKKDVSASDQYDLLHLPNGEIIGASRSTEEELASGRLFSDGELQSQGATKRGSYHVEFEGTRYSAAPGYHWKTSETGMGRLAGADRLLRVGSWLKYRRFLDDFPVVPLSNVWEDTVPSAFSYEDRKRYVVRTAVKVLARCILMSTSPGDLILDPTCGSGTTAYVAEKYGRRWITIDTSRVAILVARQRLLTAQYPHFRLKFQDLGQLQDPGRGFCFDSVPHIELSAIAHNANLDPILAKHEPILSKALGVANAALGKVTDELRKKLAGKLIEKQRAEGKRAVTAAEKRRWELPAKKFEQWTVPFDTDPHWPKELSEAVTVYRKVWRAKLDEVNACIDRNAEQEELVDQPEIVKGVVRVSGPFTVEGVRPEELSLGEEGLFDGAPNEFEPEEEGGPDPRLTNIQAYLTKMVQSLRSDGLTFLNNQRRRFARVDALFENATGSVLHAEGLWAKEGKDPDELRGESSAVAITFGPQYGPVTAQQVEDAIRASKRYDELVVAGFSFDAEASAVIEESSHPKLLIHAAYIRPDLNPAMDGLLKETPGSQLFTVFGQPEIDVKQDKNGEWVVKLQGVDIYDPVQNTVYSTGAEKVAAWFLDSDFNGRCFCGTQAFFPNQDAWEKIAKALGSSADPEAFEAFRGTKSLPFVTGKHKRIAIKVIDPRGNEVMTIHGLQS